MDLHIHQSGLGGKAEKPKSKAKGKRRRPHNKAHDEPSQPLDSTKVHLGAKTGSELTTGLKRFEIVNPVRKTSNLAKKGRLSSSDKPIASIEKDESEDENTKQEDMEEAEKRQELIDSVSTLEGRHRRHFMYHYDTPQFLALAWLQQERLGCHYCQIQSFALCKKYPITITNDVDEAHLPLDFKFIQTSILCDGVEAAEEAFCTGCECKEDQDCKFVGCHCLQDMVGSDADENGKISSYHSEGVRAECLRGSKLESRDPIYECQSACSCSENCSNRVVERGRKIPLNIFRTDDNRGWGVRSKVNIKKGQFIDKYLGEIITSSEANRRRQQSTLTQRKDVYLFALDKFSSSTSMDPRFSGPSYEVDGEFCSGPTRFINHSCDPNVRSFARIGDHANRHIHDLAFFAIEDIPAGTELTFDYVDGEEGDAADPRLVRDMTRCLCGSDNCRGYLW